MKKNKYNPNQTGRVNYIWVLAGGYLIYLAYKLLRGLVQGDVDNPPLAIGAAILFIVVGAYALFREWRAYKFGLDNIDDPSTWSDEEEDEQLEALMDSTRAAAESDMNKEELPEEAEEDREEQV